MRRWWLVAGTAAMKRALHELRYRFVVPFVALMLGGCAAVSEFQPSVAVGAMTPDEYVALHRGDVLSTGRLSLQTAQTIRVAGLDDRTCTPDSSLTCIGALTEMGDVNEEARLATLAELWLQHAKFISTATPYGNQDSTSAWIETARYAYAYLFFARRSLGERAFEGRQTQVRDWYGYAVQQTVERVFREGRREHRAEGAQVVPSLHLGAWTLKIEVNARLRGRAVMPRELLPATSLAFRGLRGIYRRDGIGAEFVAVNDAEAMPLTDQSGSPPADRLSSTFAAWSEMPTPNVTVVLRFDTHTLNELLETRELVVSVHDPLMQDHLLLHGQRVPLAGNFTAGYGLWLARSGFSRKSLRGLMGRERGVDRPNLYLMQPFDPQRRIIVMLHGLASSPEAWVNVANEILADDELRREFQIWQIYYPTNMPLPASHAAIRRVLLSALDHFNRGAENPAGHGLVLIGHSMGGIIARMMVSTADDQLWRWATSDPRLAPDLLDGDREQLDPLLRFQPFPGVDRAIFIATPHRGTSVAGRGVARWVSGLIRLPRTLMEGLAPISQARSKASDGGADGLLRHIPNSIDQLDENDPFIRAAKELPVSDRVPYHSIIARQQAGGRLADTDDGLVPYRSSHLDGAASEKIIVSGHSVQETAVSILEIRRILHEDIARRTRTSPSAPAGKIEMQSAVGTS